jgi:hypothetical protein
VPFKTIVPPVFVQDVAVAMEVQASDKAFLIFYKYSPISLTFDLAKNISLGSVAGQPW